MNISARHILIAAFVCAGIFGYWLFRTLNTENIIDKPKAGDAIIVFGDSLVEGVGSTQNNNLVSVLSDRLGIPMINAGKSGDTTRLALQRLGRDVLVRNPKVVIILLGGNDALQGVPPEETFSNLGAMIDDIHARGSAVLLVGVRGGLFNAEYQRRFPSLALEKKVSYVPDILRGVLGNADLMSDAIHPNDLGYARMADRIEYALRPMLQ